MKKKTIVVNATALDKGGALTILKQFINAIPLDIHTYIIFTSDKVSFSSIQGNINIVPVKGVKSMFKRILWDYIGLNKWLEKHNVIPNVKLSLQNTGFYVKQSVDSYIYYHQPVIFYPYSWSLFRSEERTLWFYKHIYPLFIRISTTKRTKFFVQIPFVKNGLMEKFGIAPENISLVVPEVQFPDIKEAQGITLDQDKINLFYPAASYFYKNHQILFDALAILNDKKFVLHLTNVQRGDFLHIPDNVEINFWGTIPWGQVISLYAYSDAILFPSYIETYGLPLVEAASFGTKIIVADLPYAHQVLNDYPGAQYCKHTDIQAWSNAIKSIKKQYKFTPLQTPEESSWNILFGAITQTC